MYKTCQEKIELPDTNGKAATYCMRPVGHPDEDKKGGHSPVALPQDKEVKNVQLRRVPRIYKEETSS